MKLAELLRTNNWLSVEMTLLQLYPDQLENFDEYKAVFERLQALEIEDSEITIEVKQEYDDETGEESFVDVSGIDQNREENQNTNRLAIEFTPWKKWLGMNLSHESLGKFNELEIISHCLYEMTYAGYHEEVIQYATPHSLDHKTTFVNWFFLR
jgi:hypothetical protein